MLELFRLDAEGQFQTLDSALLALERTPTATEHLESCMRAAHSIKGAAGIIGLSPAVRIAHSLESCFVAAQRGVVTLRKPQIETLLGSADLLKRIADTPESATHEWSVENAPAIDAALSGLAAVCDATSADLPLADEAAVIATPAVPAVPAAPEQISERTLRVGAVQLNRLLGAAAESQVEARWLTPFARSLLRLKRSQTEAILAIERLREALPDRALDERARYALDDAQLQARAVEQSMAARLSEFEGFDHRATTVAHRLYDEALRCRMRPFGVGTLAYPRMVRDLAHSLKKNVRLEIEGEATLLDRDIAESLDAPLLHLLRNAIDHGIESPQERSAAGKVPEAVVRLEASHSAGMLHIVVADDGRGIDFDELRRTIVERRLINDETASLLSHDEMLEFLFLPGFSTKTKLTEISGRGVGLDVVADTVKRVGGSIRVSAEPGKNARFDLQLPLSLSITRTLLADIGGEPYAFPLAHVIHTLVVNDDRVERFEGRRLFEFNGRPIDLIGAECLLKGTANRPGDAPLSVIVIGDTSGTYGLVVDRFLGERELVTQLLDSRFGKVQDVMAGALMDDGSPVLILDVEDLLRSAAKYVAAGTRADTRERERAAKRKRILVVDDSLTVRELERKILDEAGYDVDVAVHGMDGWNAVRAGQFDLIVTDIDMPRLDGIELVTLIKKTSSLASVRIIILSYKDREDDRKRGLDAGADYYLTKESFHDETLLRAVASLIGKAA